MSYVMNTKVSVDYTQMGSLMENWVDCAVVSRTSSESVRLPNYTTIFQAELHAIMLAMRLIRIRKEKNFYYFL